MVTQSYCLDIHSRLVLDLPISETARYKAFNTALYRIPQFEWDIAKQCSSLHKD